MTIKDIARECGCAVGTVSRVLNNQAYVSDATRQRVMEVVNKYGFVLNKNAKELKARGSKTIVIIVKGSSNILLNSLLEIIQSKIEPLPYVASVVVLDEYDNEAQKAYNVYCEKKPLGFIFLGGNPERHEADFERIDVPCVLISTRALTKKYSNLSSVSTDGTAASCELTEFLIRKGHRKIGVIGGDFVSSKTAERRFRGFMEALEKWNMEFDFEKSYSVSKYSFEGGARAAEELVKKFPDVTAVFAMSDVMAIGAARKLHDLGFRIPDDISIVGFDGLDIGMYYTPRLATIKQMAGDMAVEGVKALLDCIEKKSGAVHKKIPFKFYEGESVKQL